jgi:hypothetical protein
LEGSAGQGGGVTISLDFALSLAIANDTLLFPLTGRLRAPSESEPGDLIVAYTRAGSSTNPEALIRNPFGLSDADPALLTAVTITEEVGSAPKPLAILAMTTCLTLRTPAGHWQAFLLPTNVSITGRRLPRRLELRRQASLEAMLIARLAHSTALSLVRIALADSVSACYPII